MVQDLRKLLVPNYKSPPTFAMTSQFFVNFCCIKIQSENISVTYTHANNNKGCIKHRAICCASTINRKMSSYEGLTSSYVLILGEIMKLNALYRAVYMSRSIRPNKGFKIDCKI